MLFMKVYADPGKGGGGGRAIKRTGSQVSRVRATSGQRNVPAGNYRAPNGTRSTAGSLRVNKRGGISGNNTATRRNLTSARQSNRATTGARNTPQ